MLTRRRRHPCAAATSPSTGPSPAAPRATWTAADRSSPEALAGDRDPEQLSITPRATSSSWSGDVRDGGSGGSEQRARHEGAPAAGRHSRRRRARRSLSDGPEEVKTASGVDDALVAVEGEVAAVGGSSAGPASVTTDFTRPGISAPPPCPGDGRLQVDVGVLAEARGRGRRSSGWRARRSAPCSGTLIARSSSSSTRPNSPSRPARPVGRPGVEDHRDAEVAGGGATRTRPGSAGAEALDERVQLESAEAEDVHGMAECLGGPRGGCRWSRRTGRPRRSR